MPEIAYDTGWKPRADTQLIIDRSNAICAQYQAQGFDLTLRQLYYQHVARGYLPNKNESYDKLGTICTKARMHGMMDWDYLVDRTRNVQSVSHWDSPQDILDAVAGNFAIDKWVAQPNYVEAWVEKEALSGVLARSGRANDVPWFPCRGYTSTREIWVAAQRIIKQFRSGKQRVIILHLGDHDPSGLQMSEDNENRLYHMIAHHLGSRRAIKDFEFRRIALTEDQISQYNPPPNPAKESDSRYDWYVDKTGLNQSWELDALDPNVIVDLVNAHVEGERDNTLWLTSKGVEARHKALLKATAENWEDLIEFIDSQGWYSNKDASDATDDSE